MQPFFIAESEPTCTCTGERERFVPRDVLRAFVDNGRLISVRVGDGPHYHRKRLRYCRVHGAFEVTTWTG